MKKLLKWAFVIIGVIIGISIISAIIGKDPTPAPVAAANGTTDHSAPSPETKAKTWTSVQTFKGSGMKKSGLFKLSGGEARLKYKYKGDNPGAGMFAVYVLDKGIQPERDGALPEVMTQEGKEESESAITRDAGEYYIWVNAVGKWEVSIEEYN